MILHEGINDYNILIDDLYLHIKLSYNLSNLDTILFLHGLSCSLDSFRNLFDEDYFPDKNLLLVDLIGFGSSSKPNDFSYTMYDQASVINKLISQLPTTKLHIVAHSMGGAIALLLDENILNNVVSFTNIEGNLISDDCGILSRGVAGVSLLDYQDHLYKKQLEEFKGHHQLRFEDSSPTAIYKSAKSLVNISDTNELLVKFKNIPCRKSYFYGDENCNMLILKLIDFAEKIIVTKSGHGMMTENSKEFYTKLQKFICG